MDLINLLKLAGLAVQSPAANTEVEEDVPGKANTKPDPQIFPDGPSNLGSVSDTSLRRYLKARGQPVSVDETTYPDYSVDDVLESYEAYTAEKAKNPYAIGMASAMKTTGDKPPLKKSTINKAHKIAKGIDESSLNEANWRLDGGKTHMVGGNLSYDDKLEYLLSDEDADVINNFLAQADDDEKSKVWRMFWDHQEMGDQAEGPELAIQYAKDAMGMNESDEAMSGTYAEVEYDYSEDFGMITLYKNGQKIEHWNGYFGADTVGNPLADKFVELAMKHNLNPEGMSITDDTGATGTFGNNTFNWDQFAKESSSDETEDSEYDDHDIMSDDPPAGIDFNTNNLPKVDWDRYSDQDVSDFFRRLDNLDFENNGSYRDDLEWLDQNVLSKRGLPGVYMRESYISELNRVLKNSGQISEADYDANYYANKTFPKGPSGQSTATGDAKNRYDAMLNAVTDPNGRRAITPVDDLASMANAALDNADNAATAKSMGLTTIPRPQPRPDYKNTAFDAPVTPIEKPETITVTPLSNEPSSPDPFDRAGRTGTASLSDLANTSSAMNRMSAKNNAAPTTVVPTTAGGARPEGPAAGMPKAPPQPASFKDAFRAARKAAGGAGGVFMWNGKPYQTNIKGEPAMKWNSKDLKKVGNWSASESVYSTGIAVNEAVAKIACTKCDEVSTAAAWNKNHDTCPKCKTSKQGVAEAATPGNKSFEVHYTTSAGTDRVIKVNAASKKAAQDKVAGRNDFGSLHKIVEPKKTNEAAKPDFLDMDKDGNKKEPMKKAVKDKEKVSESILHLKRLAGL